MTILRKITTAITQAKWQQINNSSSASIKMPSCQIGWNKFWQLVPLLTNRDMCTLEADYA